VAAFDKLSKAFDKQDQEKDSLAKQKGMDVVRQSLAIVRAIDKLKSQGIKITKKAQLDYILALRVLEKADISEEQLAPLSVQTASTATQPTQSQEVTKRTPQANPKEFKIAMNYSQKIVAEVEEMLRKGQSVAENKLEEYGLCKKFIEKYTGLAVDVIQSEWISKES
jgi:hypothetical protein